jgi:cytochrome c
MAVFSSLRAAHRSRWLGGASLAFGALLAIQPVAGASATSYGQADPAVQAGQAVIIKSNCGGCHTIPGIPGANGTFGPNLGPTDSAPPVSGRGMIASFPDGAVPNNSPDDVAAWILDPPSLKPGTAMPKLGLSPDDAAAAAAYLYAIQPDGSVAGLGDSGSGDTGSGGMGSGG